MKISVRIVSLVLLLLAGETLACSCYSLGLEGQYQGSTNVFTAVVTGAGFDEDGNIEADFEVTEVFKGDIPFDKLRTPRGGASCGASATVGPEYVFFIGDDGRFGLCSGNKRLTPGKPSPWLDILRAHKTGKTSDLSSPWMYREFDGMCTLQTDFRATKELTMGFLGLEHRYAKPENRSRTIEPQTETNYSNAVLILPTRKEPADARLTLQTLKRAFVATWSDDAWPGHSRGAFQLTGEDVRLFARELLLTSEVQVEGSLRRYPSLEGTVIRTTNAGSAISDFVECASR